MTYSFEPGQTSEIVEIPIDTDIGTVVHVVVEAPRDEVKLLSGLDLLDDEGRPIRANTHNVSIEENTSIPSKFFTLNPRGSSKLRVRTRSVRLKFPSAVHAHAIAVKIDQPSTTLRLGALVEAHSYQPGDKVRVDFELSNDGKGLAEIHGVESEVVGDNLPVPINPKVELRDKRGGSVMFGLPAEAKSGPLRLKLRVLGTRARPSLPEKS